MAPGNSVRHACDMNGSLQLREYPAEVVRLSCEKCCRAGQYRKANLVARYGADIRLPDLREEIAQCERLGKMHDACMVRYVDLIPKR
jgi:protein tyrosine/serine phosphatase